MPFEWLTFDCYGTLIDWEEGILKAIEPFLTRAGLSFDPQEILSLYGRLESEAEKEWRPYRQVLQEVGKALAKHLGFELLPGEEDFLVKSLPFWRPFPEVNAVLSALREQGLSLAIISNIDQDLIAATLKHFTVSFQAVITAEEARCYKPGRAIFEMALRRLGVPKEKILHVGQSLFHDIAPGKKLGLRTVWVRRPGRDPYGATPPAEARPDWTIPSLEGLLKLLQNGVS